MIIALKRMKHSRNIYQQNMKGFDFPVNLVNKHLPINLHQNKALDLNMKEGDIHVMNAIIRLQISAN